MFKEHDAVLVVEDIVPARQTVINLLSILGCKHFHEAGDGQEALEVLGRFKDVTLIVSDWKMPRMSGVALLKEIRTHSGTKNIPFLLLTSRSESQDVAQAMDLGVSGYLVKPVTIRALEEKIASIQNDRGMNPESNVISHVEELLFGGQLEAAEMFLAEALNKDNNVPPFIVYGYALVAIARQKNEEADRLLAECSQKAPFFAKALFMRSKVLESLSRLDEADECLTRACELSPRNTEYFFEHGKVLLNEKRLDKARLKFQIALNNEPQNSQLKQDIWNIYLDLGFVEEVQRDFAPYLYTSLTSETLNHMGLALRKKGLVTDAIHAYRDALRNDPGNAQILYNLAMAELRLEHRKKAGKHFEAALEIDPDFESASRMLARLKEKKG